MAQLALSAPTPEAGPQPPEELYCVCRQPDDFQFMIGCDNCDEWFHGACVDMDEAKSADIVAKGTHWRCPLCVAHILMLQAAPPGARTKTSYQPLRHGASRQEKEAAARYNSALAGIPTVTLTPEEALSYLKLQDISSHHPAFTFKMARPTHSPPCPSPSPTSPAPSKERNLTPRFNSEYLNNLYAPMSPFPHLNAQRLGVPIGVPLSPLGPDAAARAALRQRTVQDLVRRPHQALHAAYSPAAQAIIAMRPRPEPRHERTHAVSGKDVSGPRTITSAGAAAISQSVVSAHDLSEVKRARAVTIAALEQLSINWRSNDLSLPIPTAPTTLDAAIFAVTLSHGVTGGLRAAQAALDQYRAKARTLLFNLKRNAVLCDQVMRGDITASQLVAMSPRDMEVAELKAHREDIARESLEKTMLTDLGIAARQVAMVDVGRDGYVEQEIRPRRESAINEMDVDVEGLSENTSLDNSADIKNRPVKLEQAQGTSSLQDRDVLKSTVAMNGFASVRAPAATVAESKRPLSAAQSKDIVAPAPKRARPRPPPVLPLPSPLDTTATIPTPSPLITSPPASAPSLPSSVPPMKPVAATPIDGEISLPPIAPVWTGAVVQISPSATFPAVGYLLGPPHPSKLNSSQVFTELLPTTFPIHGRINPATCRPYIRTQTTNTSRLVLAVQLFPRPGGGLKARETWARHVLSLQAARRWGVVGSTYSAVKDMYLVPCPPGTMRLRGLDKGAANGPLELEFSGGNDGWSVFPSEEWTFLAITVAGKDAVEAVIEVVKH